jgi:hypothetical protein
MKSSFSIGVTFAVSLAVASAAFAGDNTLPVPKKSAKAGFRPEATSPKEDPSGTRDTSYDSPSGSSESAGSQYGDYDADGGPLGLFRTSELNVNAFSELRNYASSLNTQDQIELQRTLATGAAIVTAGLATRALMLSRSAAARIAGVVGLVVTTQATASEGDMVFNDRAYAEDPTRFVFEKELSTADLVLWAQNYGLTDKIDLMVKTAQASLCDNADATDAQQFCQAL